MSLTKTPVTCHPHDKHWTLPAASTAFSAETQVSMPEHMTASRMLYSGCHHAAK